MSEMQEKCKPLKLPVPVHYLGESSLGPTKGHLIVSVGVLTKI